MEEKDGGHLGELKRLDVDGRFFVGSGQISRLNACGIVNILNTTLRCRGRRWPSPNLSHSRFGLTSSSQLLCSYSRSTMVLDNNAVWLSSNAAWRLLMLDIGSG
jgi:hypothetical protein